MQIQLQKIIPTYFEQDKIINSQIWAQKITFTKGEHAQIIAASGRGKTSLIHFIYGLRKDYDGTICYGNENINSFSLEEFSIFRQRNISIIFQDLRLFRNQTVIKNLELKRQLNPYHPKEKITEMARRLGIENKLNKSASTCSYGEQQRVAIIRSLLQPFDFLLLDEPFSNLDDNNIEIAMELIAEECSKRNASMIFADLKKRNFFNGQKILQL
ncbi:MAG: ATP-binding cassette domain-containing protein [Ginsengibacter sp.]